MCNLGRIAQQLVSCLQATIVSTAMIFLVFIPHTWVFANDEDNPILFEVFEDTISESVEESIKMVSELKKQLIDIQRTVYTSRSKKEIYNDEILKSCFEIYVDDVTPKITESHKFLLETIEELEREEGEGLFVKDLESLPFQKYVAVFSTADDINDMEEVVVIGDPPEDEEEPAPEEPVPFEYDIPPEDELPLRWRDPFGDADGDGIENLGDVLPENEDHYQGLIDEGLQEIPRAAKIFNMFDALSRAAEKNNASDSELQWIRDLIQEQFGETQGRVVPRQVFYSDKNDTRSLFKSIKTCDDLANYHGEWLRIYDGLVQVIEESRRVLRQWKKIFKVPVPPHVRATVNAYLLSLATITLLIHQIERNAYDVYQKLCVLKVRGEGFEIEYHPTD